MFEEELIEYDTDDFGFVSTQSDLIQIKFWKFHYNSIKLVGTITFHHHFEDFIFKGIVNRSNSSMVLDIWFQTGISDFVVEKSDKRLYIDFLATKYFSRPDLISNYYQFKNDYPEYTQLELK